MRGRDHFLAERLRGPAALVLGALVLLTGAARAQGPPEVPFGEADVESVQVVPVTALQVADALDTLQVARRGLAVGIFGGSRPRLAEAGDFEARSLETLYRADPGLIRELTWPDRTRWLSLALTERDAEWSRQLLLAAGDDLPPPRAPSRGPASLALALNALRVLDTDAEVGADAPRTDPDFLEDLARRGFLAAAEPGYRLRDEAFYRLWLWAGQDGDTLSEQAWADSLALLTPRSSRTPAARLTRARALLAAGHPGAALEESKLALPDGDSADLRWTRYRAMMQLGFSREAAFELEYIVGHFGTDPIAVRAFRLRDRMGETDPALALPPEGRLQLAAWLLPQPSSGAVEMLLAATTADTLSEETRTEAGLLLVRYFYRAKRYGEAEPLLRALLDAADPGAVEEARFVLARILRNTGRVEEMEPLYRKLIEDGDGGQAAWELGRELESLERWKDAERVWTLHLKRFPNHGRHRDVLFRRGFARVRLGKTEDAVGDFRAALKASTTTPQEEQAAFWLARTLRELGRDEEAMIAARAGAWRTEPSDYYGVRLRTDYDLPAEPPPLPEGLPMRATDSLVQLIHISEWPGPVTEHYRRGLELAELGELGAARSEWTRAATLDRNRESLFEALAMAAAVHHVYPEGVRWANRAVDLLPARDPLRAGYERLAYPAAYYGPLTREANLQDVEPELVWAIMRQESLYDPLAVSSAGARGLMQILPATLGRLLREQDRDAVAVDALFRPELNLALGEGFLAARLAEFDGRLLPTLAAYNAGENKARQWLRAAGGDSEEVFVECIGYPETHGYVRRIVWLDWVYRSYYGGHDGPPEIDPEAR